MDDPPPLLCKIPDACRLLCVGRTKFYALRDAGEIEVVKVGGSSLVPLDSIQRFVERLRTAAPRVQALIDLTDENGMLDLSRLPAGTSLADLEALKRIVADGEATDAA